MRCGFSESLLEFHPELCCEPSPLLLRLGFSSRALRGSRSLKQIGMPRTDSNATKTTIHFSPPENEKKTKKQLVPFAKSTRAPQVVLTTSYPSEPGILGTSVSKCNEKRIVCFRPSFPEDLRVSLPLRFLLRFSLGRLSTAILIQLCRSGSPEGNSFSHPERLGPALPSQPCPGHLGMGVLHAVRNCLKEEKIQIHTSFLFKTRFFMNFPISSSQWRCNALSPCH